MILLVLSQGQQKIILLANLPFHEDLDEGFQRLFITNIVMMKTFELHYEKTNILHM